MVGLRTGREEAMGGIPGFQMDMLEGSSLRSGGRCQNLEEHLYGEKIKGLIVVQSIDLLRLG